MFEQGKAGIRAAILKDSVSPRGFRLTSFEIEYPRFILAELNTHKMLSKNSASSRAIPTKAMHESIRLSGAQPVHWGKNQPGMQAKEEITGVEQAEARLVWDLAKTSALHYSQQLSGLGVHKQLVNRITEPWMMMKTVITGTEWANFYHLRDHSDAQPEIGELAKVMHALHKRSKPQLLYPHEWHLPYVETRRDTSGTLHYLLDGKYIDLDSAKIVSASCCAQVSYRKNDTSIAKAEKIFNQLINSTPAHASPVEHQAMPMLYREEWEPGVTHMTRDGELWSGNLCGWIQYRKLIPNEAIWGTVPFEST